MVDYLINLAVAICFGVMASNRGRNWFGWALIGAVLYFIVDRIVTAVGNSMFGPVSFSSGFYLFFFISSLLNIGVMVVIGRFVFRKQSASLPEGPKEGSELICLNCSKQNEGNAKFCIYCGTALSSVIPLRDRKEL